LSYAPTVNFSWCGQFVIVAFLAWTVMAKPTKACGAGTFDRHLPLIAETLYGSQVWPTGRFMNRPSGHPSERTFDTSVLFSGA